MAKPKEIQGEFAFDGEWIPSVDPMKIGENNFALLRNFRYKPGGIEPVEGYTSVVSTALATYLKPRAAIQLRSSYTQKTYVVAECWNTGLTASLILVNETTIPNAGDFEDETGIFTPDTAQALGRFSYLPRGIGYANEKESCIWEGEEMQVAAVIRCEAVSNLTLTDPVDFSEELSNEAQDSLNIMALNPTDNDLLVFSTRPLKAIKIYVKTANDAEEVIAFTSGGVREMVAGDTITGATSGSTATVVAVELTSGTWAGGDAAGNLHIKTQSAAFVAENLDTGGQANNCTVAGNSTAAALTLKYWIGTWSSAASVVDNTESATDAPLGQTGTITFTSTVSNAKPAYVEGYYLYAYHLSWNALNAPEIYSITVDAPFQEIKDIWDGVYRECIACQVTISSVDNDYTLEVNEESNIDYPIAARIGTLNTTDNFIIMCEEQAAAINIRMLGGGSVNTNAANLTVKYWTGDVYVSVGTVYDGTKVQSTKTLSGSGVISWDPISKATEKMQTMFGVTGYAYQISVSAQLSGAAADAILIDTVTFVPAPRNLRGHRFTSRFQGRALFCCDVEAKEENRVDYTMANAPDVHNGEESSARGKALYFAGQEALTAGANLYNRFGSQIYETWLGFKEAETHLLHGTGPDDFKIYQISTNYGCPAPKTLAVCEIAYEIAKDALRNIAIWLSYRGPVIFDGAVIVPLTGLEIYFDPRLDTYVNKSYINRAHGWFDSLNQEYNLCFPTGSSTTCNIWVVYDLARKRWYQKYMDGGAAYPQANCIVRDTNGFTYPYLFTDTGYMLRDGYGTSWNGVSIIHKVKTADLLPTKSIFDISRIQELIVLHQTPDFDDIADEIVIHITHYRDGFDDGEDLDNFSITYDDLTGTYYLTTEAGDYLLTEADEYIIFDAVWYKRYARHRKGCDLQGLSHQFEFWRQSDSYDYRETFGKTFLGWGFRGIAEDIADDRI